MIPRIWRLVLILGTAGTLVTAAVWGPKHAVLFLAGAGISAANLRSWTKLGDIAGGNSTRQGQVAGVFFAFRFALIGVALYVIVKVLGITPVAMIAGLLTLFAAVVASLVYEAVTSK